jgi:AraC-like DNA-binding protein
VLAPAGPVRYRPASTPAAGRLISAIWETTVPDSATALRVLPDAAVDIVLSGGRVRVAGPDTGPCLELLEPGPVLGVQLVPDAVQAVLGVPASAMCDNRPDIAELWGSAGRQLSELLGEAVTVARAVQLLEGAVTARAATAPSFAQLGGLSRLVARRSRLCAREIGLSERQLRRRCVAAYGYGPKTLARIVRFQGVLGRLRTGNAPSLTELAIQSGYVDQAHLAHDVGEFSGMTPAALRRALAPAP